MQAVILAAGRGTRMNELTTALPKPMLDVGGKPLLEYKLEALPDEIDEVILIVGYLGTVIQKHFGGAFAGKRILYVEQSELNGTAGALWLAKDILKDRFLVMNADDIYSHEDMEAIIASGEVWRLLVQQKENMGRSGNVELDEQAHITAITESDKEDGGRQAAGLASTNMFLVDARLFSQPMVPMRAGNLEFGLPQTIIAASKALGVVIEPVFTDAWIEVNAPKDLVYAAQMLEKMKKA